MLDVRRLRVLLAVRDYGSIAAAAAALSFTPPAVSQQMSALERQLQTALLDRGHGRVRLTDAGHRLAGHAERVLACLEAAEADMAVAQDYTGGVLRVGTLLSIGVTMLPDAAEHLADHASSIDVHLEQMEAEESLAALKRGHLDVALAGEYGSVPQHLDASLTRHDLLVEAMLVALPDHTEVDSDSDTVHLNQLARHRWLAPAPGSPCLTLLERACGVAGYQPHIAGHCADFTLALRLVAAKLGCALVPATIAYADNRAISGVRLMRPEPPVHRTLYMATRRGSSQRPTIQRLRDALTDSAHRAAHRLPEHTALPPRSPA